MKKFINAMYSILVSLGEARHGAWLARQGRVGEAKAIYGK